MSIARAFLSYSSVDREFVEAVAARLGRASCVYDQASFLAGDNIENKIEQSIRDSDLLVFFASRASMRSFWVNVELSVAAGQSFAHRLRNALVIAIDTVPDGELPPWLRRTTIKLIRSADVATREIRSQLDMLATSRAEGLFVGRQRELRECEEALAPSGDTVRRAIILCGLEGIGRRTLCKRIARDFLQLRRISSHELWAADTLTDLALRGRLYFEPPSTPERMEEIRRQTSELPSERAIETFVEALRKHVQHGELPVLLDQGGLFTDDRAYSDTARLILEAVSRDNQAYLVVVSKQRPPAPSSIALDVPCVSIGELKQPEMQRLISLLAGKVGISLAPAQLTTYAARAKGYPPSAYYVVRLLERYGPGVLENRGELVDDFHAVKFMRYLSENSGISPQEQQTLRLLRAYSPLPIPVVASVLCLESKTAAVVLSRLIDASVVYADEGGLYGLAGPLDTAVGRLWGEGSVDHEAVLQALQSYLDDADPTDRPIILLEHVFRASSHIGRRRSRWALGLTRDLMRLANEKYHSREYDRSIEFAQMVIRENPGDSDAHSVLVRSLIQMREFERASKELSFFARKGGRDYYYHKGFMERKAGRAEAALDAYEQARNLGYKGKALMRELAHCCLVLGRPDEARAYINGALAEDSDNPFLLDLAVRIALASGDLDKADRLINALARVDRRSQVLFRRSIVARERGDLASSLSFAREAVESAERNVTFEQLSQLAKCQIGAKELNEASSTLRRIDTKFPSSYGDIRHGLWCSWYIAKREWAAAEERWKKLTDPSLPVHSALRARLISGMLADLNLHSEERDRLEQERAALQRKLGDSPKIASELFAEDAD